MKHYFDTIDTLDRFTLELDRYQDGLQCHHCATNNQFVSHGFVYKQRSQTHREAVGKRIFCSNRHGRSGCGRTVRLYIASEIPSLQYGTAELFIFLSSLLAHFTVKAAYQKATLQSETRNAWRWLSKLKGKLTDYRCLLQARREEVSSQFSTRIKRLHILLPTLQRLFATAIDCPCAYYQTLTQSRFM
jgi:hypothetical protein